MKKQPDRQVVAEKIAEIEAEMKRNGMWGIEPLREEQYDFRQGFGMDTMAFVQWLQFIFIPRVKEIIASGGEFPKESHVCAQALRELDGEEYAGRLLELLGEFDDMFG